MDVGFPKSERLKSKKDISALFQSGESLFSYPIKWVYRIEPLDSNVRVNAGVSVSKRRWKRAVDRNRIKRKLREVYRLNKSKIYSNLPGDRHMDCMLIYVADKELSVADLESSFQNILDQWAIQSV
jgi:ribonuclease P protein component